MDRLCKTYHVIQGSGNHVNVFMPGMIYKVEEFKDGQALVNGIWAPDYIFNPKEIKELSS